MFQAEPEDNPISDFNNGASVAYRFYYMDGSEKKWITHGEIRIESGKIPNDGSINVDITGATITGGNKNYMYTSGGIGAMTELTWIHNGVETFGYLSFDANNASQLQTI